LPEATEACVNLFKPQKSGGLTSFVCNCLKADRHELCLCMEKFIKTNPVNFFQLTSSVLNFSA